MLLSHTGNSSEVCFVLEYTALQHVGGRRGLLSLRCRLRHRNRLCCSSETSPANHSKQLSPAFAGCHAALLSLREGHIIPKPGKTNSDLVETACRWHPLMRMGSV